jgi:hypothetical protein
MTRTASVAISGDQRDFQRGWFELFQRFFEDIELVFGTIRDILESA